MDQPLITCAAYRTASLYLVGLCMLKICCRTVIFFCHNSHRLKHYIAVPLTIAVLYMITTLQNILFNCIIRLYFVWRLNCFCNCIKVRMFCIWLRILLQIHYIKILSRTFSLVNIYITIAAFKSELIEVANPISGGKLFSSRHIYIIHY